MNFGSSLLVDVVVLDVSEESSFSEPEKIMIIVFSEFYLSYPKKRDLQGQF